MSENGLLDKARVEIKLADYGVAPSTALSDPSLLPRVQEYRRQSGGRMYPLGRDDIRQKVPTADYHVSRKLDGEFTVLIWRNGQICTLNPGGTVRVGLPWEEEAARLLSKAKVKEAMVVGELYLDGDGKRTRVHDVVTVARQPQSAADLKRLRFAVFDLISLDENPPPETFDETWKAIQKIFGGGELVHPVEAKAAKDADEVEKLFEKWVENEGAEGLVARSDTAGLFKIKPRHTLDAAVIGFTESVGDRQGMLHDLLLAVMRHDETLHVLTRVGGGFNEDERRTMLSDLKDMVVQSEYAEVNSDHVAYQMVQPDWVVEISCLDLVSQNTRGGPVNRMVLDFSDNGAKEYHVVRRLPLAAVISPQFVRRREDKSAQPDDIRIEQVADRVEVPLADRDARQMKLPKSEVLRREVYTKQAKGETMVRKFLLWQTNKAADSDEYPAFVLYYTDFSPNRKAPLASDIRVSSSLEQLQSLWDELKEANIKKGWELQAATNGAAAPAAEPEEPAKATAPKKKAAKKVAAKDDKPEESATKKAAKKKTAKKKTATKKTPAKKAAAKMAPSEQSKKKAKKKSG